MTRILIGDDQPDVREALRLLLKGAGHQAQAVDSPSALLHAAETQPVDLVLMDMNYARDTTSGEEGLDLLARLHARDNPMPILVMTAWGSVSLAVEAMRRGACDFIEKPWDNQQLLKKIDKALASKRSDVYDIASARVVQRHLMPDSAERHKTVQYAGASISARSLGGDYYDFMDLGPGRLGLLLADVSGKGTPAALLMANLQGCIRSHAPRACESVSSMLEEVNRVFQASTLPTYYATLFFAAYDETSRQLCYANCGHLPAMLLRSTGEFESLESTSTVIGMFPQWECVQATTPMSSGDTLFVYSDGVLEAGVSEEEFGEERIRSLLTATRNTPVPQSIDRLLEAARAFSNGQLRDDLTAIALRIL